MRYAGLATQWMAMLLIAVWAGYKLDQKLRTTPIFVILFPVLSLAVSMWQLVKELNKPKK
jgi:F0F1-type ATP synthase assembly protein I